MGSRPIRASRSRATAAGISPRCDGLVQRESACERSSVGARSSCSAATSISSVTRRMTTPASTTNLVTRRFLGAPCRRLCGLRRPGRVTYRGPAMSDAADHRRARGPAGDRPVDRVGDARCGARRPRLAARRGRRAAGRGRPAGDGPGGAAGRRRAPASRRSDRRPSWPASTRTSPGCRRRSSWAGTASGPTGRTPPPGTTGDDRHGRGPRRRTRRDLGRAGAHRDPGALGGLRDAGDGPGRSPRGRLRAARRTAGRGERGRAVAPRPGARPATRAAAVTAAHYLRPVARDVHGHVQRLPPAVVAARDPAHRPTRALRLGHRPRARRSRRHATPWSSSASRRGAPRPGDERAGVRRPRD